MDKKKLQLEQLKVKSFVTVIGSADQKTAKGGYIDYDYVNPGFNDSWTGIKTRKSPFSTFLPQGSADLKQP